MARAKTAKATITAYLKGKGLDTNEIKEAFDELDAADQDLEQLATIATKNAQWETFWTGTATPEFDRLTKERDSYKSKVDKLAASGFKMDDAEVAAPAAQAQNGNYMTPEAFEA